VFFEETQAEEVLHLGAVDFLGPVPMDLVEGFEDREAGGGEAAGNGAGVATLVLPFDEAA
jgi:hypothetical protein